LKAILQGSDSLLRERDEALKTGTNKLKQKFIEDLEKKAVAILKADGVSIIDKAVGRCEVKHENPLVRWTYNVTLKPPSCDCRKKCVRVPCQHIRAAGRMTHERGLEGWGIDPFRDLPIQYQGTTAQRPVVPELVIPEIRDNTEYENNVVVPHGGKSCSS
jgi:hypothetical protein